ncbi:GAF domain-containing protein [Thetidibacter halocola]|uniref:GAF domain-containing protein n=1 Tax=Thetidibacter halocola TaxID=2827239 RepID=A0A8J7W963_9RHOB|nr:GAF domain-containing protein [Thetidibacter halocola]MBS0123185.1 GAF domain-containing protein [Thetidibacter halocola]
MEYRKSVAICHLSELVNASTDPLDLAASTFRHLHDRLGYRRAGILLLREGASRPQVYARCPGTLTEAEATAEMDRVDALLRTERPGVVSMVLDSHRPMVVNDVSDQIPYLAADPAMRSEACFPLCADNRCFGVFDVESEETDKFDWDDFTLLSAITAQIGQMLARHWPAVDARLAARQAGMTPC